MNPDLEQVLSNFVACHVGTSQHGSEWYEAMKTTVGGSEIAAILGVDPYKSFISVVKQKIELLNGTYKWQSNVNCWWGTLLEDVICRYVEIDMGSAVHGDNICIQIYDGHRNSPDGYIVAKYYRRNNKINIYTTDLTDVCPDEIFEHISLLEFKCPITRIPTGSVPRQYKPQLLSGLAVSPVADLGIFVDSVFRKCNLVQLSAQDGAYDTEFHKKDVAGQYGLPVAWSMIGVYAPIMGAPNRVCFGWKSDMWTDGDPIRDSATADAASVAHSMSYEHTGGRPDDDVIDMGDISPTAFSNIMSMIDTKQFPVHRIDPCFHDGRGYPLRTAGEIYLAIDRLRERAPKYHRLLAIFPLKIFEVSYDPVYREGNFVNDVLPVITEVHQVAAAALVHDDPATYLASKDKVKRRKPRATAPSATFTPMTNAEIQSQLFDFI
jgi:hypothetical protein